MKRRDYKKDPRKALAFMAFGFFVVTGTYNAVVINSESHISSADIRFVKRLDEVYGIVKPGRLAASVEWRKITPKEVAIAKVIPKAVNTTPSATSAPAEVQEETPAVAAVQEELSLNLVEVVNPKKWQNGLPSNQFAGNLATNNGVIESLNVSLPNGEGVSVTFSEMSGNVFEYDLDGEMFSGMMYQIDQSSYMVTLTNGPLEGTRMKFSSGEAPVNFQAEEAVAENTQPVEVGNFGQEQQFENQQQAQNEQPLEQLNEADQAMQTEAVQAQAFNLEQQQAM